MRQLLFIEYITPWRHLTDDIELNSYFNFSDEFRGSFCDSTHLLTIPPTRPLHYDNTALILVDTQK